MASIEKARSKRGGYIVRYRGPDRKQRSQTFARHVDAKAFAESVETDVRRGTWTDPAGRKELLSDWHARWWATTVNLRPTTRARDDATWRNHVKPTFGGLPLGAIDHMAVAEWIAELSKSGLAPASVHKAHQVLAKIMRAAVDANRLPASPCDKVKLPRIEREEMRFLEPKQVAQLAESIDERYRALVFVGAYCGLRAGEMFGLRRSRVDLLRRRIDVAEIVVEVAPPVTGRTEGAKVEIFHGPPKTRAGRRSVPVPQLVADELARHLAGVDDPDAYVFGAPHLGPVRASQFRRRTWQPACIAAGLGEIVEDETGKKRYEGLRLHDLRHSAVALWIAAGGSAKEIAARAGHTSVSVVLDRYGHLLPHAEERTTDALDAMARAASTEVAEGVVVELKRHR